MKTTFLFLLVSILTLPAFSQEETADPGIQRPDSARILNSISADLKLSSKQEEKIAKAMDRKTKDFDKTLADYEKNMKELKKFEYKVNELKYEMLKINKALPDVIREFLDDEQKIKFDEKLNPKPAKEEPKELKGGKAGGTPAGTGAQPKKKKRVLVRKKKAQPKAAQPSGAGVQTPKAPPEPAGQPEDSPEEPPAEEDGVYYP